MYRISYRTSLLAALPFLILISSAQAETGLASYYAIMAAAATE